MSRCLAVLLYYVGGFESQDNITASAAFIPENLLPSSVNFVFFWEMKTIGS